MDADTADIPSTTRVILVADWEGDVFDVFCHAVESGRDVLVRAAWDRRLVKPRGSLGATVAAPPVLGTVTVAVPRHDDASSRTVVVSRRRARRDRDHAVPPLRPPPPRRAEHLAAPTVTAVWEREERPPEAAPPLERMLLTALPVEDLAAADPNAKSGARF